MENNEKVMLFRDAAVTVIERKKIYEDDQVSHEQLIYNAGYNAGVLDLMAQIEGEFVKEAKKWPIIEEAEDSDIEKHLGGND